MDVHHFVQIFLFSCARDELAIEIWKCTFFTCLFIKQVNVIFEENYEKILTFCIDVCVVFVLLI